MDTSATYYETLITRYLSAEASPEEISELTAWVVSGEENLQIFREYRKSWGLLEATNIELSVDVDSEWTTMSERLGLHEKPVERSMKNNSLRSFLRVAAIFLIFLLPGLFYYWNYMRPDGEMILADNHLIESTLPDGTEVILNAGSSLQYPDNFKGKERNVALEGEAFFDVAHNKAKPFVIEAGELDIRVLGTSFYVNTNGPENTIEVVLVTGEVKLNYNGKEMLMQPGEKAVVLKAFGEIVKKENDDPNYMAWKTKRLEFNGMPLSEIVALLTKVYHKDIVILNPELLNCRVTATFEEQSLEQVLLVLHSTLDLEVRPNGQIIEISGSGCQ